MQGAESKIAESVLHISQPVVSVGGHQVSMVCHNKEEGFADTTRMPDGVP